MKPVAFWIALTISGGISDPPKLEQVDIGGAIMIQTPIADMAIGPHDWDHALVTLGPLIFSGDEDPTPEAVNHELQHVRQWEALGPGFGIAYLAGQGREFEDYLGDGEMWDPPSSLKQRCPVLRFTPNTLELMPCYHLGRSP